MPNAFQQLMEPQRKLAPAIGVLDIRNNGRDCGVIEAEWKNYDRFGAQLPL